MKPARWIVLRLRIVEACAPGVGIDLIEGAVCGVAVPPQVGRQRFRDADSGAQQCAPFSRGQAL